MILLDNRNSKIGQVEQRTALEILKFDFATSFSLKFTSSSLQHFLIQSTTLC